MDVSGKGLGKYTLLASVAILLSLAEGTSAYVFEHYGIDIRPSDDVTREILSFTIANDEDEPLTEGNYTINTDVSNVKVFDDKGLLQSSSKLSGDASIISFRYRKPLVRGDSARVSISFESGGILGKSSYLSPEGITHEDRVVSTAFVAPAPVEILEVRVHLPEGAWLARSLGDQGTITGSPVQPLDAAILSNGTSLSILWMRYNLSRADRFDIFVAYRMPGLARSVPITALILASSAGAAMGGLCAFLILRRRTIRTTTQHTLALLEQGERKVLKLMMEAGGEIRQDDLIKATGYSRARISQLVTHLEKLGLIRKERFERTNKLFLTGEVRET